MTTTNRNGTRLSTGSLRFVFDGREYAAQQGDTAAAALLANGVRLMGRSVKYRRRRGLLASGPEEPNALLSVGVAPAVIPNVPAPQLQLQDGLVLRSQNRWPTLRFDMAAVLQTGGGLFSAGFYYKTFIWPSWKTYESLIRRLAGLGEAPRAAQLPTTATEHLNCDVLIVGAGAAGLAAAHAAARRGARVVLCEREPVCGGELEFETAIIGGRTSADWIAATLAELAACQARVLTGTALVGGAAGLYIAHAEPGGLPGHNTVYRIRARSLVMAMGAVERPIAFVDNDRPGVMLLGAAEQYLARYGVQVGRELLLYANHDRVYAAAARLRAGGMRIRAIVDTRPESRILADERIAARRAELQRAGVECLAAHAVLASRGGRGVSSARVAPIATPESARDIACDTILVSGGWTPLLHAGVQEGGQQRFDPALGAFVAGPQPAGRSGAGATNGLLELGAVIADGHCAGAQAARLAGSTASSDDRGNGAPAATGDGPSRLEPYWRSPASSSGEKRQFIDFQNDVTVADLRLALAEGFSDIEHAKRYTTLGIGTEQGRSSGLLGAAILAELKGESLATQGTSRLRPPYHPVTMQSLAGPRVGMALRVTRRTPLHVWHLEHGGVLETAGLWLRPRYYRANGGDATQAGIAEARRVRQQGGMVDGSTLGKLEVAGADAAAFLDRMYLNRASNISLGRAKYMVNLREDGMVLDDGIVLRLAADRFLCTTGTGHGTHMLSHFEHYRDIEWSGRRVAVTDVTEAWAVIVVAGPVSREVLQSVLGAAWQGPLAQLQHMDFTAGEYQGAELRLLRASFSGELAYELHIRAGAALLLWEALAAAGLEPYGLEALDILRLEKGYLVSSELNGQTTPYDLGMESLVALGNACVGRELLDRPAFHEAARPRLVGLRAADGRAQFLGGAQIVAAARPNIPCGYVTSSAWSPALNEWVGLGLVARELAVAGRVLSARDPVRNGDAEVRICSAVHFDPTGARMKS